MNSSNINKKFFDEIEGHWIFNEDQKLNQSFYGDAYDG